MATSTDFLRAVEEVKVLRKRPGKAELTDLYGLYKQATSGDVDFARPGIFNYPGQVKWDAWNSKKDITMNDAKNMYVELVEKLKIKYGMEEAAS